MASMTATFNDGSQVEVGMFGYASVIGVPALMGTKLSLYRIYTQIEGRGFSCTGRDRPNRVSEGRSFSSINAALCSGSARASGPVFSLQCQAQHGAAACTMVAALQRSCPHRDIETVAGISRRHARKYASHRFDSGRELSRRRGLSNITVESFASLTPMASKEGLRVLRLPRTTWTITRTSTLRSLRRQPGNSTNESTRSSPIVFLRMAVYGHYGAL